MIVLEKDDHGDIALAGEGQLVYTFPWNPTHYLGSEYRILYQASSLIGFMQLSFKALILEGTLQMQNCFIIWSTLIIPRRECVQLLSSWSSNSDRGVPMVVRIRHDKDY